MMRTTGVLVFAALLPSVSLGAPPSGLGVELYDVVLEPEADLARFRFVAPELASLPYAAVAGDLPWLCDAIALPELRAEGWNVGSIVISVGDRVVALGELDASAVQYFDVFRVESDTCILELF